LTVNTLNDRYRIEEKIGSGGMATVYLAFDQTLERTVAVKVMNQEISSDPSALERFRREARAVARLSHPHVVMVIDAGEEDGRPYIVFECVKGETLKERIRRGPLPVSEAIAYAIEIGRALEAAHERNLVHRDVKPQNVLIDEEDRAKVTDFGIARSVEMDDGQLTAAGRVVGTTDYISPEQALGLEVTPQSDIYSLGIVLYEMLIGEIPFKGENSVNVAMKHVRDAIPDVQKRRPEASAALAAIVERATAKQLDQRYRSAGEMVGDLEDVLTYEVARAGGSEGEATAVLRQLPSDAGRKAPSRRRGAFRAAWVLAAIALAAVAGLVINRVVDNGSSGTSEAKLSAIRLGNGHAQDYDPPPGGGAENSAAVPLVLDRDRQSYWSTEHYSSAEFGNLKDGVGVYLDAGRPIVARAIRILTPASGWALDLYVANRVPGSVADWTRVGGGGMDSDRKTLGLDTGDQRFRYFLVWITKLVKDGQGQFSASISELRLLG